MAQHRQAAEMANGPIHPEALAPADGHDSTKPPATIDSMPNTTRRPAFSLKTTHASKAVNTASRFNKREAIAPLVWVRPNIRATGPRTPPKAMAPSSQGHALPQEYLREHRRESTTRVVRVVRTGRIAGSESLDGDRCRSACSRSLRQNATRWRQAPQRRVQPVQAAEIEYIVTYMLLYRPISFPVAPSAARTDFARCGIRSTAACRAARTPCGNTLRGSACSCPARAAAHCRG